MDLLHKNFTLSVKAADDATRTVQGYASTYNNVDEQGDMILPGAFTESLAKNMPIKMLAQHDTYCPIGLWTKAKDDATGLLLEGPIVDTDDGINIYKLLKAGVLDSISIGYTVDDAEMSIINGNPIRVLKKLTLWEASIVTFPANTRAKVTNVKNNDGGLMTERQFEEFLRDVGKLSQQEAKTIVSKGYKSLLTHRDGEADEQRDAALAAQAKGLAQLNDLLTQIKEISL